MKHKKILILMMALCSCIFTYSREKADSLKYYLQEAAYNNPTVLQKLNEYQAALQKVPQAGSLSDPELNIGVFLSPMELIAGNQVASIQLMQMFPWFGVLKNAKDEMSLMAMAKFESLRDARLQVFFDVQRTWYELQKNQQDIQISEKNAEILKSIERLTMIKFKTGASGGNATNSSGINRSITSSGSSGMQTMGGGTPANDAATVSTKAYSAMPVSPMGATSGGSVLADLYRIQIEIGDLENNIALLKNQQNTIVARFNSYLNRSVTSPVSRLDELKPDTLGVDILTISDSMLIHNPMLGMLKYEKQSLDARGKMVNKMGYPMVGVGLDYSLINKAGMSTAPMNGKDMIMPMVKLTLPIYRKKYKAMRTENSLMRSATEENYKAVANTLQTDYYEALQSYQDAARRMKLYDNQRQLAKKSLDIMIKTFSVSGAGMTDILQIRQQLLDYEFKNIEAIADYNTSIAWLKKLMATSQIQ